MRKLWLLLFFPFIFGSCTNDAYETGDSRYSYLRADFVETQTDAKGQLVSATRDDDVKLLFSQPVSSTLMTTPDSTYRTLLYYNIGDTTSDSKQMTVQPVTMSRVYVLEARYFSDTLTVNTDPVYFQSAWESKNKSYANLSLDIMTGVADSVDARQSIGLVCDTIISNPIGGHTYYYRLLHDQGNVPQYYKATVYISIPTKKMTTGDIVRLSLNTYDGWIVREYRL